MAVKQIRVSDLTGEEIRGDEDHASLVVVLHPSIPESVELDVRPEEVEGIVPDIETHVYVQYMPPTGGEGRQQIPLTFAMPVEEFNRLAGDFAMETILQDAYQRRLAEEGRTRGRRRRQRGERRERIDYASPDHAGEPHRGRITDAEKEYVRDNLAEVNRRLREKDMREIDPTDPEMAERYGLSATAEDTVEEELQG